MVPLLMIHNTCNHSNALNENMVPVFMGHLMMMIRMMMMIIIVMLIMMKMLMMMIQCETCLSLITLIMLENKVGIPSHDTFTPVITVTL